MTLILVWQGAPQNFMANQTVTTIEGTQQDIAMGPIASLVSIKHLGTNGGGFLGANSTTPLENPTIISDITELLSMMILPGACVIMFGLMYHNRKKLTDEAHPVVGRRLTDRQPIFGGEGRTVFVAMGIIFVVGLCLCYFSELAGNPKLAEIGLSQSMGSMEGKEVRFGIAQSAMFTTTTTSFTTGTVNNMHDTLTPLGGMIPLLHMMLNVVFGGKGVGLMNMIMYVMLAVFLMMIFIDPISNFINGHPEMKMLALTFIVAIGGLLVIDSAGFHTGIELLHMPLEKLIVYFAMVFCIVLELIQMRYNANFLAWRKDRWKNETAAQIDSVRAEMMEQMKREDARPQDADASGVSDARPERITPVIIGNNVYVMMPMAGEDAASFKELMATSDTANAAFGQPLEIGAQVEDVPASEDPSYEVPEGK